MPTSSIKQVPAAAMATMNNALKAWGPAGEYMVDVMQRNVLFWDVMSQRSRQYYEQKAKNVPHVLTFDAELVLDARTFEKPVNYLLVRIKPLQGVTIDPLKRPFVVVDPRAGHGPGIGGFKADSEIGVAMRAGHPCYFVGFTPEPMPGQTIEDIMYAEAKFLEKVIALHPQAEGKPCVIGNCQAGWAVMMLAALRPELFGPIIVPGSPLSYWAGIEGENPMRYSGGLAGGTWMTALVSDLSNGKFDGGHLVENFENQNPANTLWGKNYALWSKVDTEGPRFIEFEKWWGGHVNLNAEEIQWIVDELFVGNRLATAEIVTKAGERIDLRNIRSPIVCFCSKGDNITPPQQALGWIVDLYASDEDVLACGQTIIYAIHESVGHLGIFVSGGVAKKEHQEFASNIDLIDVLPPGIYEAVMTPKTADAVNQEGIEGDWIVRFEPRKLSDIHAIVAPSVENERRFAAARRVSEINLGLYRTLLQPWVKAAVNEQTVEWMKSFSHADLPFAMFSDRNPLSPYMAQLAEQVREQRQAVSKENPLLQLQSMASDQITSALDAYRDMRDSMAEKTFLAIYSSPLLQAMVGLGAPDQAPRKGPAIEAEHKAHVLQRIAELKAGIGQGGVREAAIRSLVYIGMAGSGVDERSFNELIEIRSEHHGLPLQEFKQTLREQYFCLKLDCDAALAAIPKMLPPDADSRAQVLKVIRRIVEATGDLAGERAQRFAQIEQMFEVGKREAVLAPKTPERLAPEVIEQVETKVAAKAANKAVKGVKLNLVSKPSAAPARRATAKSPSKRPARKQAL